MLHRLFVFLVLVSLNHIALAAADLIKERPEVANKSLSIASKNEKDLDLIRLTRGVKRVIPITIDRFALLNSDVNVRVPGGPTINLQHRADKVREQGRWEGRRLKGFGSALFFLDKNNVVSGNIRTASRVYEITNVGASGQYLVEVDPAEFPPEHPANYKDLPSSKVGASGLVTLTTASANSSEAEKANIDILVILSPSAVSYLGSTAPEAKVEQALYNFNEALNGIALARVNYAGTMYNGQDFASAADALNWASLSSDVARFRDSVNADVVVFIAYYPNESCGLAREILAGARTAFATISANCLIGNYSLAHEVGHLLGARHNFEKDSSITPYKHGHGFAGIAFLPYATTDATTWDCFHTIMSYAIREFNEKTAAGCLSDPRVNVFSSTVRYVILDHDQAVVPGSNYAYVESVIRETAPKVARFSETKLSNGVSSALLTAISNVFQIILD